MKKIIFLLLLLELGVSATDRKLAHKIYTRITSTPPSKSQLDMLENYLSQNRKRDVVKYAIEEDNFYNIRLKNWVKSWTNEEVSNRVELNDYVATVIGFIRDDRPFDQILSADITYTGRDGLANVPPYANDNNDHYEALESQRINLRNDLVPRTQSALSGVSDTAGVITTRAAAKAFFSAGTNRAMTRYTFMNFLCKDFEDLHDTNVPGFMVRRDVDRSPGGDSRAYINNCVGCHAGQDALGGAFAYFDYKDDQITYTPGQVVEKINLNNLYAAGHVVTNDSWKNLWARGQNASLGWRGTDSGTGARSLGELLGSSRQFSRCMVERTYKLICLNDAKAKLNESEVNSIADMFETSYGYKMKDLFTEVATRCL